MSIQYNPTIYTLLNHQNVFTRSAVSILKSVYFCTSSSVKPSAISVRISLPYLFSNTAFYVITILAFDLPVRGSQQVSTNLNLALSLAFSALCCITTMTFEPQFTKSMAPPMPFATLPGIIQFAISPFLLTCRAPSIVMSKCPPLMMANDSEDEKKDPPGKTVIVYLPAFIKSASSCPRLGYGPTPITPFSACTFIWMLGGRQAGRRVGIPIPRFTLAPSKTYCAALFMIFILIFFSAVLTCSLLLSLNANLSIFF